MHRKNIRWIITKQLKTEHLHWKKMTRLSIASLHRMELLKIIKYPEISYKKFFSAEYFGRERKQNRRVA